METKKMERIWKIENRAWIFYMDQVKDDENIVCGEIEGLKFLIDCETARLSLWVEKWNTFVDVGVSKLLRQLEKTSDRELQNVICGTRIFYKGIELRNGCPGHDMEILEFIDIKGELERKYINISRSGFTEQGEYYFKKEIYPDLIEAIHRALGELEKDIANKGVFYKRIHRIVEKRCNNILEKIKKRELQSKEYYELISFIVSVCILSYYAGREKWDVLEQFKYTKENTWEELIIDIHELLNKEEYQILIENLEKNTFPFNLQVLDEKNKVYVERATRSPQVHFEEIFLKNRHWAVLQAREGKYSPWKMHLIRLENGDDNVYEKIISISHTEEDEKWLEEWGRKQCDIEKNFMVVEDYKQQLLLKWMLKNIPTIGIFCDETGDVRVNVLGKKIYPSIYMNRNFKFLIMERMMEKADTEPIKRFSTITWQGMERLACEELPYQLYFIKRGYFSPYSFHRCIVPLHGELIKECRKTMDISGNALKRSVLSLLDAMDIERYLNDLPDEEKYKEIREYLKENPRTARMDISAQVLDLLFSEIENNKELFLEKGFSDLFAKEEIFKEKWENLYFKIAQSVVNIKMEEMQIEKKLKILFMKRRG